MAMETGEFSAVDLTEGRLKLYWRPPDGLADPPVKPDAQSEQNESTLSAPDLANHLRGTCLIRSC